MKVKMLVNHVFLENLSKENLNERYDLANPERYGAFRDVFGKNDFGFILAGDLEKEISSGIKAPVYVFGSDLYPSQHSEGVDCSLFLPSSFSFHKGVLPSVEGVYKIMDYLEGKRLAGDIKNIVNSKKATLSEDKISILDFQNQGFNTPKTFQAHSFEEFQNLMENSDKDYVVKHRFGQEGRGLYMVNSQNIGVLKGLNLEDFIVQEKLNILNEKRIIFFEGDFLGARIIHDRHMPWEQEGKVGRKHLTKKYIPSSEEIENSKRILDQLDVTVGCIDWVNTVEKGETFLEYNGFGTGYGRGQYPYNLNRLVAERLKGCFSP